MRSAKVQALKARYIGDKAFYLSVVALLVPMVVQQGITQFVSLLDNVMVGRLGTIPMSAVAIVNQVVFIFNLTVFGGMSGASIFGAQYYGKKDDAGLRDTVRFRVYFAIGISALGVLLLLGYGQSFCQLFLNSQASTPQEIAQTLDLAGTYLRVIVWGLPPFALSVCFSSALRNASETVIPMTASVISIFVNLILNWLLIFGVLGFPKMGVAGAALATVIARYVELLYLLVQSMRHTARFPFLKGLFRSARVPLPLVRRIAVTGTPLMLNEALWSVSTSLVQVCYASRGLAAVAASNINGTVFNLFALLMMSMGDAVGIMVGQQLGANDMERAKSTVHKLLVFGVGLNAVVGLGLIFCAPFIPLIYNTEPAVRDLAAQMMVISGFMMPWGTATNCAYFTIRSGGRTFITFLFDCVFNWAVCLPLAYVLCYHTAIGVAGAFLLVQCADLLKCFIGMAMLKSGIWAKNVVNG